jgi:hypothetical protein
MQNPVVGGGGGLIRAWIQSPDFVTGSLGWRIARDGSAEFNNVAVRGQLTVRNGDSELFVGPGDPPQADVLVIINPDTNLYDGALLFTYLNGTDRAGVELRSPVHRTAGGADYAFIGVNGETTALPSSILLSADSVTASNFAFQGSADEGTVFGDSGGVTPGNNVDVVSVTIDAAVGDIFRIDATWHGIGVTTPVAVPGNRATMRLMRNGAQFDSQRILPLNTTLTQCGGCFAITDTPGAGSFTYTLNLLHEGGSTAGSMRVVAGGGNPANIMVEGFRR